MTVTQENPDPPGKKTCSRCGILKSHEEFSTFKRGHGRSRQRCSKCKECMKVVVKKKYQARKKARENGSA